MTIESPQTYGEYYWSSQFDASLLLEEKLEESVKPFLPSIFTDPEIREALPFDILKKIEGLLAFPSPGLGSIGGRFVSEVADSAITTVMTPALRRAQYTANRIFTNVLLTPDQATALYRRKRISKETFDYYFKSSGFGAIEQQFAYQGSSPFPTMPELFRWARYHGSPENTWGTLVEYVDMDPLDYPKWDWLTQSQFGMDQLTQLHRRGKLPEPFVTDELMKLGWTRDKTPTLVDLSYLIPNAMLLLQADLLRDVGVEQIMLDLGIGDIHADYRQHYIDAVLTKPASSDLIAYHLRQENDLTNLAQDLKRIGIHPKYLDIYQTLAEQIPPVNDIITMAVREAFSPETAKRFGQYEDFPEDFARYAGMQGVSQEWAERYWASHWALPSLTQGFSMFHRGIVDHADLTLLLKAQDTMPFWRDKLIQMAFKPLTRVDVRRMYKEGVLDESGVYQAYLNVGYSTDNAEAMTEFTVRQTLSTLAKFSTADVVKAYTQRMIDKGEARSIMISLGLKSDDINYILSTADYKKEWEIIEQRIRAVRNLYRKGEYDDNQTRSELLKLDLPTGQVDDLMDQWWYEKKADGVTTWSKAETIKFMKAGLITEDRAKQELTNMGYDTEHVDLYIEVTKLSA